MAKIRPFKAIRPNPDKVDLNTFLFDPEAPVSIQALAHPQGDKSERSKFVRYARATSLLYDWLGNETLQKTDQPGILVVETKNSKSIIALAEPEPGVHPLTNPAPRETQERTWLLEATNTQIETVGATTSRPVQTPDFSGTTSRYDDPQAGTVHTHWITDPAAIQTVQNALQNVHIGLIQRIGTFESVRNSFEAKRKRNPQRSQGAVLCSVLLEPSERPIRSLPIILKTSALGPEKVQDLLLEHFDLRESSNEQLMANMQNHPPRNTGLFGLALPGGYTFTAQAKDIEGLVAELAIDNDLDGLDHQVLQRYVFEKVFGMTNLDVFTYAKTSEEALDMIESGEGSAFFLPDPELPSMEEEAIATGVFPPRSVDLSTPVPTGLAMWSLNDLEA